MKNKFENKSNVILRSFSDLNHIFMQGSDQPSPDEYYIADNVDEELIINIYEWIDNILS